MNKATVALVLLLYLGTCGEHLALWSDIRKEPLKIFPHTITMYPETDQKALRRGIPITSLPEAYRLLEDYFS